MATIVNNPQPSDRIVEVDRSSDTGGWVVAIIILLIVIVAGAFWYRSHRVYVPVNNGAQPAANVNVTIPAGTGNTGNAGAAGGGTAGGGTTGGGAGASAY